MMEALKLNTQSIETGTQEAGYFAKHPVKRSGRPFQLVYRRIGGTVYKVRVFTSEKSTDNVNDKIIRLIKNQAVAGEGICGSMDIPQMSQPPEGSSA
jgi:hypothetical protein